jgi:outer membrane protein TolC
MAELGERLSRHLDWSGRRAPALEAAVLRARYRLSWLCGEPPTVLDAELRAPKPLPGLKSVALGGIGSPESLLLRRPDIRAAEQQADARGDAAMIVYERTVLSALEETEGALADYSRSQLQADVARAAQNTALIARERFTVGG